MLLGGRYRCSRLLKSGLGIETYYAEDMGTDGSAVVVKLLRASEANSEMRQRLEHEASVLTRLGTENFKPLLAYGHDADGLFLVQPYWAGANLAGILGVSPLSVASTLAIARDLLRELARAHEEGILHRDVKPANVIVRGGEPLEGAHLIDWGLSLSPSLHSDLKDQAVGTARYLSPEQAGLVSATIDGRSDIYSLGAVLHECLTGTPLFDGSTVGEVLRQHLSLQVPGLRSLGLPVPRAMEGVIMRMLGKEPGRRYQSANGALADIEEIIAGVDRGVTEPPVVIGLHDRRSQLTEPAFVGRSSELETLSRHLRLAGEGHMNLVYLAAESGGGKSRLLEEFSGQAAGSGAWILHGQGVDQAAQRPYQLLEGVAEGIHSALQSDRKLLGRLLQYLGDRAEAVAVTLPALAPYLDHGSMDKLPEAYGEVRSLDALSALIAGLGTPERPAVLLLDDCQWTDGLTAKVLERLLSRAGEKLHLLIVAAFRSEEVGPGHPMRRTSPTELIKLHPLTSSELRDMAQSMAGRLPQEVLETVASLSEGSPFMASAVLMGLVECGAVVESENGWTVDPIALAAAQTSRRAAIFLVRRLELLPPEALRLLSTGAVLGKEFDLELALSLTGQTREETWSDLAEARSRRIIWVDEAEGRCRFLHDKIREALLSKLEGSERTGLHLRAALEIERLDSSRVFELAYHFDAAGAGERALPFAIAAAEHARQQHTLEIAEVHYRMAERSAGDKDVETRRQITEGLGDVLTLRGSYEEAVVQFNRALEMTDDPQAGASLQGKLGDVAFRYGDMAGARTALEGALRQLKFRMPRTLIGLVFALVWEAVIQVCHSAFPKLFLARMSLNEADRQLLALRLYSRLAYVYWFHSGKLRCGWAHLREMNLAERYPPTLELAQAYSEHAPVMTMIPWFSRGLEYAKRSHAIRTDLGDIWGQGQSLNFEGVTLYAASRFEEAIDRCQEARRLLDRTGDRWEANTAGWNICFAQYRLGRLDEAVATARDVHGAAIRIGDQAAAGIALSGWSRAAQGDVPASLVKAQLDRGVDEDASTTVEVHLAEAVRLLAAGETDAAIEVLRNAHALVRRSGLRQEYVAPVLPWLATALRTSMEQFAAHSAVPRRTIMRNIVVARRAVRLSRSYRNNLPQALREQGLIAALDRRPNSARRKLSASLKEARAQGAAFEEAQTLAAMARIGEKLQWPDAVELRTSADAKMLQFDRHPQEAAPDSQETLSLADRFSAVMEAGRAIASSADRDDVYEAVQEAARTLLRGEHCFVLDLHGRGSEAVERELHGNERLSYSLVERALELDAPVVANFADDLDATESMVLSGVRSVLCAPISSTEGAVALLYVTHGLVSGLFGDEEIRLAAYIATLAGAALDHVAGSEARFHSLAQNSSDVITIVDRSGTIIYQSSSVERIFGYQPLEMIGSRLQRWVHPEDADELARIMDAEGSSANLLLECRLRRSDGTWRYTETTVSHLLDDPTVRGVVLNTRDVTERKAIESQRRKDEEALRLSQKQLAEAQRLGHFGSLQVDLRTGTLDCSEELRRIFGVEVAGCGENLDAFVNRVHPDDREHVREAMSKATDSGGWFETDARIVRPDGDVRVLACRGELLFDADRAPSRILLVCQDVTEQRQVEQALRASEDRARNALEQAVEASRLKSQFLANMSHEIRTPMNGVLGMAHLLMGTKLTSGQRRYLEALQESGSNLLDIINDILDFSKVEAGKIELETIPFDLTALVEGVFDLFTSTAETKGLTIAHQIAPEVPQWVSGDPVRVRQVLTNLVGNAVKFTDSGRVDVIVDRTGPDRLLLEVRDTGIGIEESARHSLLDPFTQADNSTTRRFGGTGLGLAICSQLVELMGGTLTFESEVGLGSSFYFDVTLPEVAGPHADAPAPVEGAASPASGRVLLVEDSSVNQLVATGMLEAMGYSVEVAANGAEALEAVQANGFDVVLMDCLMPVMDGYEATARIRRLEGPAAGIPIVALTASAMATDRERCLKAGMDYYLSKPMDPKELTSVLESARSQGSSARLIRPPEVKVSARSSHIDPETLDGLRRLAASGDGRLLDRVIEAFLTDTPTRINEIRSALRSGNAQAVVQGAHALKGSCRNIGANQLAELAAILETMGSSNRLDAARDSLMLIESEFEGVKITLAGETSLAS